MPLPSIGMCRFYAVHATAPTRIDCALVHADNALVAQAERDLDGREHSQGWGIATFRHGTPRIERQTGAAHDGHDFRAAAGRVSARTAVAHVRRATTGAVSLVNTHPFAHGSWVFAHNGTVPSFEEAMRDRLLSATSPRHRASIRGETDSEHVFRMLLTKFERAADRPTIEVLADAVEQIVGWCDDLVASGTVSLNLLMTDGRELLGTRVGRSLYYARHEGSHECGTCGRPHADGGRRADFRAIELASEPIGDGGWTAVPETSAFRVTPRAGIEIQPLRVPASVVG